MDELWKKIDKFPEYEVSNFGRVRSIDRVYIDSIGRTYRKNGQILKLETQIGKKDGYKQIMVGLWSNKKMHRLIVSRLVATAFIPNPDNLPQVNHKDEDSTNNYVDNLEWCSASYNINYGGCIQRKSESKSRGVNVYDSEMNLIDTLPSGKAASEKYNVSRGSISSCCNGKRKSVKGLYFKFC